MGDGPISILIVDDDPAMLAMLEVGLAREYRVRSSLRADEALAWLDAEAFDLVVTDYRLDHPQLTGLDILKSARRRPATLVIIITAYASMEVSLEAIRLGAYDFLTKPFQLDELFLVVRNAARLVKLARENDALRQRIAELLAAIDDVERHYVQLLDKVGQWERELGSAAPSAPASPAFIGDQIAALRRRQLHDQIAAYMRMGDALRERLADERRHVESLVRERPAPDAGEGEVQPAAPPLGSGTA